MKNYQYLNLEQKMAKIRKKMPSLLKKFHNNDADYDFATLDDIYESMTPALNKYGVNFDIVGEKPTQHNMKKLVYLTQDPDGFWRYESDLEICWINIDNPKEERRAMIHILGTHEIPDKARGTAMTYGLKYYFRNKFCMRQIDSVNDDPDGMEYGTEGHTGSKERSFKAEKGESRKSGKPDLEKPSGKEEKKALVSKEPRLSGNCCFVPEETGKTAKKNISEETRTGMPVGEPSGRSGVAKGSNSSKPSADINQKGEKEQQKSVVVPNYSTGKKEPGQVGQAKSTDQETVRTQSVKQKASAGQQAADKKETKGQQAVSQEEVAARQTVVHKAAEQQTMVSTQTKDAGDGFRAAKEGDVPFEDASFMEQLEQELVEENQNADSGLEAAKNFICTFGLYNGKKLGDVFNSGIKGQEAVKWIAYRYQGPEKEMINAAKLVVENPDEIVEPAMEQQAA